MAANGKHIPLQPAAGLTNAPCTCAGATTPVGRWRGFVAAIPMRFALLATSAVWAMGCLWSFREQALFAQVKGFHLPWLLPAVIDGLAIALAFVAYAASLDARAGVLARAGTAVAVVASAASNATFAWQRSGDPSTVVIAAGVPVAANLAFEVLLHELRRQVLRRRGLPAPASVPYPRLIRVVLAPASTLRQWRRLVLDLTALPPTLPAGNPNTPGASAASRTFSVSPSAANPGASAPSSSDAPVPRLPDASEPGTGADAPAPSGATATPADTSAAPIASARAAATRQVSAADTRQVSQPDARQGDTADAQTPTWPDAGAGVSADADASACTDAGASSGADVATSPRRPRAADRDRGRAADAAVLAEEARQLYRASLAAGDPLTGRRLGHMYQRSPSWGRERIGEAKAYDRSRSLHEQLEPTGPGRPPTQPRHQGAAQSATPAVA